MSTKQKELLSTAMKRTSEWIFSNEFTSDVNVNAGGTSFSLHKFPLVTKCGSIRKLVSESIDIPDIPGGSEAFELAAKFCYRINFEISTENIAMLRCDRISRNVRRSYAIGNLIGRTEAYINEVTLKSLAGVVSILRSSENLLPTSEEVKLVSRCIDTIAFVACKDSQFAAQSGFNESKPIVDWWAEDLTILRIDFFERVLICDMGSGWGGG